MKVKEFVVDLIQKFREGNKAVRWDMPPETEIY